jgi:serine/threonine protein kinase
MQIKIQKPALIVKENVRIYQAQATQFYIVKQFSIKAKEAFEKEKLNLDILRKVIPTDEHLYFCFDIPQSDERHTLRQRLIFPKYDMDLKTYLLNTSKPLDFKKMDSDISTALTIMHKYGFVHNDIKPENILVDLKNNRFVLADFGFTERKKSILNGIVGSYGYMSPRMLKDSKVTSKNDWWSYACLLVNALTVYCLDIPEKSEEGYSVDFEPDEENETPCNQRDYLQLFKGTNDMNTLFVTPTIADDLCEALQVLSTQTQEMQGTFIEIITQYLFTNRTANAPLCKDFTSCIIENINQNAPQWAKHSNKWILSTNRYKDPDVQRLLYKALYIFLSFAKNKDCKALFKR